MKDIVILTIDSNSILKQEPLLYVAKKYSVVNNEFIYKDSFIRYFMPNDVKNFTPKFHNLSLDELQENNCNKDCLIQTYNKQTRELAMFCRHSLIFTLSKDFTLEQLDFKNCGTKLKQNFDCNKMFGIIEEHTKICKIISNITGLYKKPKFLEILDFYNIKPNKEVLNALDKNDLILEILKKSIDYNNKLYIKYMYKGLSIVDIDKIANFYEKYTLGRATIFNKLIKDIKPPIFNDLDVNEIIDIDFSVIKAQKLKTVDGFFAGFREDKSNWLYVFCIDNVYYFTTLKGKLVAVSNKRNDVLNFDTNFNIIEYVKEYTKQFNESE